MYENDLISKVIDNKMLQKLTFYCNMKIHNMICAIDLAILV